MLCQILLTLFLLLLAWQPVQQAIAQVAARKALEPVVVEALLAHKAANALKVPQPCLLEPLEEADRRAALSAALRSFLESQLAVPPNAGLERFAGFGYCLLGKYEQAQRHLQRAIRLEPQDGVASLQLIGLYARLGDSQAAQRELRSGRVKAAQLAGTATLFIQKGDPKQALSWCRWATNLDPLEKRAWTAWLSAGSAYDQNQAWDAALEVYRAAVDTQEKLGVDVYRGSFLYHIGTNINRIAGLSNHPEAILWFDQALENGHFTGPVERASALIARGNWYRANRVQYSVDWYLKDYQDALAVNLKSDYAAKMVGIVYLEDLQDLDQAEVYFRVALAISDKKPGNYYYLGRALFEKGDLEGAIAAFTRAVELKPDYAVAVDQLNQAKAKQADRP